MCRLALFNREGMNFIEEDYGLENFISYLDTSFGGHGMGYSLMLDGEIVKTRRGLRLTPVEVAKDMFYYEFDWAIFHTRLASMGSKLTRNCHPFTRGNTVLAMNGTERDMSPIATMLDTTDTEAILRTAKALRIDIKEFVKQFKSVFIGFDDGLPFVATNGTYSDLVTYNKNDIVIFASEFPRNSLMYKRRRDTVRPFYWEEGMKIKDKKPIQHTYRRAATRKDSSGTTIEVAPIYTPAKARNVYQPKDNWYDVYRSSQIDKKLEEEERKEIERDDWYNDYL